MGHDRHGLPGLCPRCILGPAVLPGGRTFQSTCRHCDKHPFPSGLPGIARLLHRVPSTCTMAGPGPPPGRGVRGRGRRPVCFLSFSQSIGIRVAASCPAHSAAPCTGISVRLCAILGSDSCYGLSGSLDGLLFPGLPQRNVQNGPSDDTLMQMGGVRLRRSSAWRGFGRPGCTTSGFSFWACFITGLIFCIMERFSCFCATSENPPDPCSAAQSG